MLALQVKGNANVIMILETKLDDTFQSWSQQKWGLHLFLVVKIYQQDLFL